MLKRLAGRPVPIATISIAGIAAVGITVGMLGSIFLSHMKDNASVAVWLPSMLFLCVWILWIIAPNLGMALAAILFARRLPSSIILLIGTILISGFGTWLLVDIMHGPDGQAPLGLAVIPVWQWLGLLLVVGLAAAVAPFGRAR